MYRVGVGNMTSKINNILKEYNIETKKLTDEEKEHILKQIIKKNNKIINLSQNKLKLLNEINNDIKNYLEKEE